MRWTGGRHTVRIDLPPDLPRVMADRQRLVQVLNNLLANAARHSPESAPIRIAAEREGLDVAVSVADEGRGIAPDQLGQLFRKYTTAGDRAGGLGSGLGLAICKGLVEAQGGRIRAETANPLRTQPHSQSESVHNSGGSRPRQSQAHLRQVINNGTPKAQSRTI